MNKKKIIVVLISCFLFVFFMTLFINIHMINSTKNSIIDINKIEAENIDAIIILGCKIENNEPSLMLSKRLNAGIDVYKRLHSKIIITGNGSKEEDEVSVMRDYLLKNNIDSTDIYLDYEGFTTYDSIYRAKNFFNAKRVIIVTQKYHLYRALYLANALDLEAYGVVADDIPQKGIMLKNQIREIFSRDKNFFKAIIKPRSDYNNEIIPIN